jgi:biotin carboxylase
MDKPKLLIAGGGYADIPLIVSAKEMGYHVITTGNRAQDLGHRYSDECRLADFSDKEAILELARGLRIDAICACCNDFSALSAAYVAEKLNLPGHDLFATALCLHHKDLYREFASENGVPSPRARGFSDFAEAQAELDRFCFPLIVKPVDLTGGKGITKVENPKEAIAALKKSFAISRAKRVIVEEFIEGSRHGFSTFLRGGKVVFSFSDNEYYYLNPYLVSAASAPSSVARGVEHQLVAECEKIASRLALKDGILHVQYVLRQETPYIIEICRRAPGDLYIKLVEHATGVDYPSWIVKASAGWDCGDLRQEAPNGFYTRHCVMAAANGRVKDVVIDDEVKENIIDRFMWWQPGDSVDDYLTAKMGIVFLKFSSMEEMRGKTERMQELIAVQIEP